MKSATVRRLKGGIPPDAAFGVGWWKGGKMWICESDLAALPPDKKEKAEMLFRLLREILSGEDPEVIRGPADIYRLAADLIPLYQEHFVVFLLNIKNRLIGRKTISVGTLNASLVHPREVFRAAIEHASASIVCVHNHPSGDPSPSTEDLALTRRLVEAGKIIGITVLDHIIVGRDGYISLKEAGHI